jgi:hypothetical protein
MVLCRNRWTRGIVAPPSQRGFEPAKEFARTGIRPVVPSQSESGVGSRPTALTGATTASPTARPLSAVAIQLSGGVRKVV